VPRIASLLPAATEIVCALGAEAELVGVSHECDFPAGVAGRPVLTRTRLHAPPDLSSAAIDRAVRALVAEAASLYQVDDAALAAAAPEVVVTQDLCEVCAVSRGDVERALCTLAARDVTLVSLSPLRLADVWDDVERVAAAIGRAAAGAALRAELEARLAAITARARRARGDAPAPRVLTVEWIAPVMIGGTWMPELVAAAGGEPLVTAPGDHAPTLSRDQLAALRPDAVVVKPCGFALDRTLAEAAALREALPLEVWQCPVWLADGSAYFNRPGPRLVESAAILAGALWPDTFGDPRTTFPDAVARL
jgi:iron complex transport system substrate-binding protein